MSGGRVDLTRWFGYFGSWRFRSHLSHLSPLWVVLRFAFLFFNVFQVLEKGLCLGMITLWVWHSDRDSRRMNKFSQTYSNIFQIHVM